MLASMKTTRALATISAISGIAILSAACNNTGGTEAKEDSSKAAANTTAAGNVAAPSKPQGGAFEGARGPAEGARGAAPTPPVGATPATPSPATPSPAQGYALDVIKPIPDNCSSAKVILTSAPANADNKYSWSFTRQAMLANQQFKVVSGPPSVPGQVQFLQFEAGTKKPDGTWPQRNLVAFCADGGTCNQLAAMYKAVVRSSNPQLLCGQLPGPVGDSSPVSIQQGDPKADLPGDQDVIGMCARLSACMIATDRSTPGDPGLECQKAPSKFKTACAKKYPCSEVLACTAQ
jgi:hypothetical protein